MSEPPRRYSWEDYLYPAAPGQPDVLRNHLGLNDRVLSLVAERALVAGRLQELTGDPRLVPHTFDVAHWKAIHHHLFQDMYGWAGEFRTVDIFNGDHGFVRHEELEATAEGFLAGVRDHDMFAGQDKDGVVHGLAVTLQAVNQIHPFREGNGRTQRVLADHVAAHAGYLIDWDRMGAARQNEVMARSFEEDRKPLREVLSRVVVPLIRGGAVDAVPLPDASGGPAPAQNFWKFTKPGAQVLAEGRAAAAAPDISTATAQRGQGYQSEPGLGR